jgi:hypothetical protein
MDRHKTRWVRDLCCGERTQLFFGLVRRVDYSGPVKMAKAASRTRKERKEQKGTKAFWWELMVALSLVMWLTWPTRPDPEKMRRSYAQARWTIRHVDC